MATITKGLAQRQDLDNYDGTLATSRVDATGGTLSGLKVGDHVDVLSVFGSGSTSNQTVATINAATGGLGSTNIALVFAPGTWTIDDDVTIASNFTVVVPAGCVFAVSAGKTLTIAGVLDRHHDTYSSGSGTVTVSGTDLLATVINTVDYALDTGAADAYAIDVTPSVTSYVAGRQFRFKAANTNTGASTLDVDSVGAKSIVQADGSTALSASDITAGQIVTVNYEGVDDEFHMVPTVQSPASPASLITDNVYTKTETWKLGADVVSATDLPINVDGNLFDVTGTTTIATLATKGVGTVVVLQFDAALTLTHDATNLDLGSANITTAAGDVAVFYEYASADWRLVSYHVATGNVDTDLLGSIAGSGITISDDIDFSIANPEIIGNDDDGITTISGGVAAEGGANLRLYGASHATSPNSFRLQDNGTSTLWHDSNNAQLVIREVVRIDLSADGTMMEFDSGGTVEGTISVSGTTTSYNAFCGSHYTQLKPAQVELPMGAVVIATGDIVASDIAMVDEEFLTEVTESEAMTLGRKGVVLKDGYEKNSKAGTYHKMNSRRISKDVSGVALKEYFPHVSTTTTPADKRVYGVWNSKLEKDASRLSFGQNDLPVYLISQVGLYKIRVTDTNGPIENGDWLETSTRKMEAQRQANPAKLNSTIGKALVDVDWTSIPVDPAIGYKWKLIPVIF